KPYPDHSTGRVLTMEYLDGIPVSDRAGLQALGVDLEQVARRGAHLFLDMIFRDGFYHADPHPGNILVQRNGSLALLDCGMVGHRDEATREEVEEMLGAIAGGDAQQLTAVIPRLATVPPDLDRAALCQEVSEFLSYHGTRPMDELDLGAALTELTDVIRRHH